MPAESQKQQRLFAIAEHHPEELRARNKGILNMSRQQMHDFAATPRAGLPKQASPTPRYKSYRSKQGEA